VPLIKDKIFINVRHLIKRILREETKKDLSPKIKKLLDDSVKPNHKLICKIDVVAPWKLIGNNSTSDYQVMVSVIGGAGSKNWPMTQFVHGSRDKIVNDVWQTVYDYMGIPTDVFLRTVKTCDEVMSESTIPNTVKRRANSKILQDYITKGEINYPTLCDDFEDGYEYADKVIDYAMDEFIYEIEENLSEEEDYYSDEVEDYLRTLCRNEFGQELIDIYNTTCIENTKQEQNESEITERCWKGYTQKGMKTMFGKKYPNCVKKKKRMNESKMMDYLKQFLSGEVLDNYKKEQGRKEFQKLVDIVYKITSKDNPIEGMVGVLVGNIDKEMWGRNFNDDNSVGLRWDFKIILKPLFTDYNPNNEPEYNERVLRFEKKFVDNARGMGFEVISPIQHPKVKNYTVKFEWASRLDVTPID
jgi:hypothetical protein